MNHHVTQTRIDKLTVPEANGPISVLAVGVDTYLPKSGFRSLNRCSHDSYQIIATFREVSQLHANKEKLTLVNSETKDLLPTRGHIIDQIQTLAEEAGKSDRILFYYSGHGHRIEGIEDHFLVPQDAFSSDDEGALISMNHVMRILASSEARQKIVILDACLSGPTIGGPKFHPAKYSAKSLMQYVKNTIGVATISSSAHDQASHEDSPNPKLSQFTYFLLKGLRGDPSALDEQMLTVASLYAYLSEEVARDCRARRLKQTPTIDEKATGSMLLGDFRQVIAPKAALLEVDKMSEMPIAFLLLRDHYGESTKCILKEWKNRSWAIENLEYAANTTAAMSAYTKDDFSKWRPILRKEFGFNRSDIGCDGGMLSFPGGTLSFEYKAESKDRGIINKTLQLDIDWFRNSELLLKLMKLFDFDPDGFEFLLSIEFEPLEQINSLEANQWEVTEESDGEVVALKNGLEITINESRISFRGISLMGILEAWAEPSEDSIKLSEALSLLAPPNSP